MNGHPEMIEAERIDYVDVSVKQCISVATSSSRFGTRRCDRALMGSNMQRQAVSLFVPDAPLVEQASKTRRRQFRTGYSRSAGW